MKTRKIAGALCAVMLLSLTACKSIVETPQGSSQVSGNPDAADSEGDEYAPYAQLFGLTAEQRREDFAYFEQELRDSYPYWGLWEREGTDAEAILDEYREMVEHSDNDFELFVAVNSALFRLGGQGHLGILQPEDYEGFRQAFAGFKDEQHRTRWYETLNDPVTAENYEKLLNAFNEMDDTVDYGTDAPEAVYPENVTPLIIAEGRIAYLKIDSFDGHEDDRERVLSFLDEVRGYEHLIIDITQNSGGSDFYWMELLVEPLAKEPLSSTNYALVRNSENTAQYLAEAFEPDELRPIEELPDLPRLEPRDRELATHFLQNTVAVEPAGSGFNGKIWLLVSERVYSAAEAFTVFCKDTGFAEIVGEPTGGGGIGIDPVFIRLPNSGLLVRYSPLFGLNPDGSGNEEYGTTPDYLCPVGESPLVTALRAIREG